MKKFTKNLMLVAAAATTLGAGAEATWELNMNSKNFIGVQNGRGVMADFNNDGRLDVYYSGAGYSDYYNKKGIWPYQSSSNMLYNNGDNTYTQDIIGCEGKGEFDENDLDDDGNPKEWYTLIDPKHGIIPVSNGHYGTFDYNNDGLVDFLVYGRKEGNDFAGYHDRIPESRRVVYRDNNGAEHWVSFVLYKNLGDGRFAMEENFDLPIPIAEKDGDVRTMFYNNFAWGDYDHDGYVDIALCGTVANAEPGKPDRVTQLWRNIDGTGRFEQMNIAETWGGAWTKEVTEGDGDDKQVVIPSEEIEGGFLLISGNVTMVDINNDGWLDLIFDGWADKTGDGKYEGGSNGRVYLNQPDDKGGRKFVDVTDREGNFYLTRGGNTQLADFNGDGYLDIINAGWGDHGIAWKTLFFNNNLGDDPEADPTTIFNFGDSMDQYGLPNEETTWLIVRDFDGDDILDIRYANKRDGRIYYGNMAGTFDESADFPVRNNDSFDGLETFGDLTGNGLCDRFQAGYLWINEEYRDALNGGGDWAFSRFIWNNTTDVEIEAPELPANVKTSIDEDAKTVTIEWDDVETPNCAYNVVVLSPSGKVISNLPVDPVTGFVKVAENKNIAIRPFVNKYTLPYNEVGEYRLGVQAVSLNNEKASAIAWGQNLVAGVGNITSDLTGNDVKVTVNGNTIVANATANADVKVIDMMGRTIATGVTNTPISVEANGVLIVNVAGKSVKVVK